MDLIEKLKHNKTAFTLLSKEEQECFGKVGANNCRVLWNRKWEVIRGEGFGPDFTYRIKSDYRPEPQVERCEVFTDGNNHLCYQRSTDISFRNTLTTALSDPDFIEAQDESGDPVGIRGHVEAHLRNKPAPIPKYVLFVKRT